jgi:membrane-associated phospholipid phosphatase
MFKEFSQLEVGVYPSGHAGSLFLFYLLVKDKWYKWILLFCLTIVIISLCLSRGHYSIDIFSGIIFAYAIKAFGEKHLKMFDLSYKRT